MIIKLCQSPIIMASTNKRNVFIYVFLTYQYLIPEIHNIIYYTVYWELSSEPRYDKYGAGVSFAQNMLDVDNNTIICGIIDIT